MIEALEKLTGGQAFLLLCIAMVILSVLLHSIAEMIFRPLTEMARTRSRRALRDKFATHALQALVESYHPHVMVTGAISMTDLCIWSYEYADRMMQVRKSKEVHRD